MFRQRALCAAFIAATGMVMGPAAMAQQKGRTNAEPQPTPAPRAVIAIKDVALKANGTFVGHVLNREGKPVDGAVVVLGSNGQQVAKQTTDQKGQFTFAGLKGGLYEVQTPMGVSTCRLWTAETAPPNAQESLVIAGSPAMRGQLGFFDPANTTILLLSIAGVTISAVALSEISKVRDDVEALQSP